MVSPEMLRRYPFFAGLNEDQLRGLAMLGHEVSYPAGTMIVRERQPATKVFVLTSGSVDLLFEIEGTGGAAYVGSVAVGEPFDTPALFEPFRVVCTCPRSDRRLCRGDGCGRSAGLVGCGCQNGLLPHAADCAILAERLTGPGCSSPPSLRLDSALGMR